MARNQEKKTPVIVVKKRRVISPPPVVDKTASVTPSVPEVAASSTSDAGLPAAIPDASPAPAAGQKKKGRPPRRPLREHWTREFTDRCMEKVKAIFPHLRAEGGGFLPLRVGISRDIPAWLAEHPEAGLTRDEWDCAVSCITSRRVYLLRTAVTGATRYDLDGKPAGQVSEDEAKNAQRWLAIRDRRWEKKQAALAGTTDGEDATAK
ncbi:proQ/FINO family protein [Escherichia marmotae]|nr:MULTISPECIES: ProQ/FINO family protein [Enterobacteriaceae]EAP6509406.1 proQ/FINO family protein [Salmonella enterica]EBV0136093.1 proQ/FINO family protein [Salmonella enterica subsp. enterica serovar Newport]ECA9155774.1 proQ/FINO family protein [Salmonella enterica subsp. enterica serovar Java]ECD9453469.1 proQ/FINO family protein [Salmonella enterica subsp. salamae serovar Sofia]ECM8789809.1 proQ/FINO family protein [Salmonella enterica subsp. enterica serovar Enteritidis]EDQ1031660.1 p